jgi:MFS transporter, OFA family, oxalate/formate antiporter
MDINKKRWVILVACCLINLCLGSIYAWSVFSASMSEYLSVKLGTTITSADLAIVYTVANSVGPITMISGGWFNDKFGPKIVLVIGTGMYGLGLILSGFATSIPMLLVTYGIIGGLGLGMAYGCTISTAVKFFPDKSGLIGGITTAIYGLSSVIVSPMITLIVQNTDATFAFKIIGVVFLIIMVLCSLMVEACPKGYVPSGFVQKEKNNLSSNDMDYRQMLRTPIFYVMILLLTCGAFSGMMIVSQAAGLASSMVEMSAMAASSAVSILALFNAAGRIVAGSLSDKIGRVSTLVIALLISIVGVSVLYFTGVGDTIQFYVGVSLVGISFGSFMGVFPGFTADQFGMKNNSVNYGIMFIGFAAAGFFGPTVMKSVSSYQVAFVIAGILCVAGLVFCWIYNLLNKKEVL